jgi:hypothetical protein
MARVGRVYFPVLSWLSAPIITTIIITDTPAAR